MHSIGRSCDFCDQPAQYVDSHTGQAICLAHARLEVRARPPHGQGQPRGAPLHIRLARPSDRRAIQALALHFWDETDMDCFGREYHMLDLPSYVACDADQVVGCITLGEDMAEGALTIVMLNILPGYNGRGAGRALVASAEAHARALNLPLLRVATSNDNLLALYFYQRLGFVISGVLPGAISDHLEAGLRGLADIPIRDEVQLERPVRPVN
mgnify:CR=1 FL=1